MLKTAFANLCQRRLANFVLLMFNFLQLKAKNSFFNKFNSDIAQKTFNTD
jgi:hypothetical protein